MTGTAQIRLANIKDLDRLVALENEVFSIDRFSRDQIEYLVTEAHASILLMELDGEMVGSAYLLWRKNLKVGRLYNIAVTPRIQGKGLGTQLLKECELEAARRQCDVLSLEVRSDNRSAITFYEKHGYKIEDTLPDYYEDGASGYKMTKKLVEDVPDQVHLSVPYYPQSLDYTCGPASMMMAFKNFLPDLNLNFTLELLVWKEATSIYMSSGLGGCDPLGLALAARRRGFLTRVILSKNQTPFFSSVRKDFKRKVIRIVHEDFLDKTEALGVPVQYFDFPFEEIMAGLYRGRVPIVLVSTYRLTGEKAPHYVVITGFDSKYVYFNDPNLEAYNFDRSRARHVRISIEEFARMRRYGKDLYKSVIFIGPQNHEALISMDGSDL
jgi:ribosomal-protein-alanine acetyltransferase